MGNVLSAEKRQQVIAPGRLGWSLRRIEEATGVRRETASTYLRAAGVVVRPPGRWGQPPKPAIEVSTDSGAGPASNPANGVGVSTDSPAAPPLPRPGRSPAASACEPYRELIATALARGRNAMAIWQDLVDAHGFPATYASVMRFVRQLRGAAAPEAHAVIQTAPGEEGQVDYGDGPMVRHPATGKYRRTRLFPPHARLQPQERPPAHVAVEQPHLGGAPRTGIRAARRGAGRHRPRQPPRGRAAARRLRADAQSLLSRRARPLRRHRAAVPGRRSRSQGEGRVGDRPHAAHAPQGAALRAAR